MAKKSKKVTVKVMDGATRDKGTLEVPKVQESKAEYYFEIYQDASKQYRWRIESVNGQVVAVPGEGYVSLSNVKRAIADLNNTDWPLPVRPYPEPAK